MNKEYMNLSDKELLVIDEKGRSRKRSVDNTNMHYVFLIENNLEVINEIITESKKTSEKEMKLSLQKLKIFLMLVPFIFGMSAYGIATLLFPKLLTNIIQCIFGVVLGTLLLNFYVLEHYKYHVKYINGIKDELSKAYELSEDFEKKLSKIKYKTQDSIITNQNMLN